MFISVAVSSEHRFAIGIDDEAGKHYLSIPVSNGYVQYSEYYEISPEMFNATEANMESALPFVRECAAQKMDHLLIQKPGKNRGFWC